MREDLSNIFGAFLIKQLFHSRLLDMRWLQPTRRYTPCWLSVISCQTSASGITVKKRNCSFQVMLYRNNCCRFSFFVFYWENPFSVASLDRLFFYTAPNLVEMVEIKEKRIIFASPTVSLETSLFKRANISKRVYSLPYYLCGSKSSKSVPLFSKPSDNRHGLANQGGVIFSKKNISHQSIRGHLYISCWSSEIRIPPEELVGAWIWYLLDLFPMHQSTCVTSVNSNHC